jgi:hypothetical protein
MTALEQAQRLGDGAKPYALQAAIAACHMRARTEETDWDRIGSSLRRLAANQFISNRGTEWRSRRRHGPRPSRRTLRTRRSRHPRR